MRKSLLAVLLLVAVLVLGLVLAGMSGWFGPKASSAATSECGDAKDGTFTAQSPRIASQAAVADTDTDGNRTVRWDLTIAGACPSEEATLTVTAQTSPAPQECPPVELRASVTTGLTETPIPLTGEDTHTGTLTLMPRPADLGKGPGSLVLSLTARSASRGLAALDDACLDAVVKEIGLKATYRPA
ncbi:MAG TPA: hypothetical protein VM286_01450 [Candidatus Thermoplasmatota archaeon]|nr:hypothetical protein [Candidatus Thermoplasmatota archaeon]